MQLTQKAEKVPLAGGRSGGNFHPSVNFFTLVTSSKFKATTDQSLLYRTAQIHSLLVRV